MVVPVKRHVASMRYIGSAPVNQYVPFKSFTKENQSHSLSLWLRSHGSLCFHSFPFSPCSREIWSINPYSILSSASETIVRLGNRPKRPLSRRHGLHPASRTILMTVALSRESKFHLPDNAYSCFDNFNLHCSCSFFPLHSWSQAYTSCRRISFLQLSLSSRTHHTCAHTRDILRYLGSRIPRLRFIASRSCAAAALYAIMRMIGVCFRKDLTCDIEIWVQGSSKCPSLFNVFTLAGHPRFTCLQNAKQISFDV